ncbi:MAG: hypothetical protein OXF02_01140 [Simkaniaceae bacterium]|nr:hypothetical protein [Simkaniaceae bacterium]
MFGVTPASRPALVRQGILRLEGWMRNRGGGCDWPQCGMFRVIRE